jgi:hypothetical protein
MQCRFCSALIAQLVEHILGKDEVSSSILDQGSIEVFIGLTVAKRKKLKIEYEQ